MSLQVEVCVANRPLDAGRLARLLARLIMQEAEPREEEETDTDGCARSGCRSRKEEISQSQEVSI